MRPQQCSLPAARCPLPAASVPLPLACSALFSVLLVPALSRAQF